MSQVLDVVPRASVPQLWIECARREACLPVECTEGWIQYQRSYLEQNCQVVDCSVLVVEGNVPIALWPLALVIDPTGVKSLGSFGVAVIEPVPIGGASFDQVKRLGRLCSRYLPEELTRLGVLEASVRMRPGLDGEVGEFGRRIVLRDGAGSCDWEMVAILGTSDAARWRSLRSSYRSLIRRASAQCAVSVHFGADRAEQAVAALRVLHRQASGRVTRGAETWLAQEAAVCLGDAFVVLVKIGERVVGGSLIHHSQSEGIYAVGAYDRDLMEGGLALGHLAQWAAMKHLVEGLGITRYRLGSIGGEGLRSKKVRDIDTFKSGFMTKIEISPRARVSALSHEVQD